jgi:serine/threonine protein kinase
VHVDFDMSETSPDSSSPATYATAHVNRAAALLRDAAKPTDIGPYHIIELIGAGGMGEVYKARQEHPIQRIVALKLIKLGMDSREIVARFQTERQTLAMMNHPNVAAVYDAGISESGRPFFVMEYVAGQSITDYCDQQQLTVRQRLELFIQACDAAQHAHQKTIVHRDLKPGNMLVATDDGSPRLKVIDFGVAKALGDDVVSGRSLAAAAMTTPGQLVGTPQYMSPEQTAGGGDVDIRSDIYSLGMVLYELLTGTLPFETSAWSSTGIDEIRRIICQTDAPRPSTRLSKLTDAGASRIAELRRTRLPSLRQELKSELEWIPLKALRKDPAARYRTAAEMADDIRNYLENRPLIAGPESRAYRVRKFLRRNRGPVVALTAVVIAVLIGGLISTILAVKLKRAADAIRAEQGKTLKALAAAQSANENAEAVIDFLSKDVIGSADPAVTAGRKLTVEEALQNASKGVAAKFHDRPLVEASVRNALAITLKAVGRGDLSIEHERVALELRQRALGPDDVDTIDSQHNLAAMLADEGKLTEAEPLMRDALERSRRLFGEDSPATMRSLNNFGALLYLQGKLAEAEPLYRQVLQQLTRSLGADHLDTLNAENNLASLLSERGDPVAAEPLCRDIVERGRRTLGPDHPDVLLWTNNLATCLVDQRRLEEAEPLHREILERRRRVLGEDHPDTLVTMNNLARLLAQQKRFGDAERLYSEGLERSRRARGEEFETTLFHAIGLTGVLIQQHKLTEAAALSGPTLQRCRHAFGDRSPRTMEAIKNHAQVLMAQGDLDHAEALLREAYDIPPSESPGAADSRRQIAALLVALYERSGNVEQAQQWRKRAATTAPATAPATQSVSRG